MWMFSFATMGWLRLVGSLKLEVSFAKEPYKRDCILQKRPIISRSLLIVAIPYVYACVCVCVCVTWRRLYDWVSMWLCVCICVRMSASLSFFDMQLISFVTMYSVCMCERVFIKDESHGEEHEKLRHAATHTATHCNTHCNTLQHILQHTLMQRSKRN